MFPLQSALLPGEDLPLRVFEPRYSTLVADCLATDDPAFGVVLIARGREIGGGDERHDVGALARIAAVRRPRRRPISAEMQCAGTVPGHRMASRRPISRAVIEEWPDEPGSVGPAEIIGVEDDIWALLETIAGARDIQLRSRDDILGDLPDDDGDRLYALAPACRSARLTGTPCWPRRARCSDWPLCVKRWRP